MIYEIKQQGAHKILKRYKTLRGVNKYLGTNITQVDVDRLGTDTWIGSSSVLHEGMDGRSVFIR